MTTNNRADMQVSVLFKLTSINQLKSLVNEKISWLKDYTPREFVININPFCVVEKYDVELEIYDYYRE